MLPKLFKQEPCSINTKTRADTKEIMCYRLRATLAGIVVIYGGEDVKNPTILEPTSETLAKTIKNNLFLISITN